MAASVWIQLGRIRQHWRMRLTMLLVNCGIIAAYLGLTGSTTPYSGNQRYVTPSLGQCAARFLGALGDF
jgi:hypothetical protein